MNLYIVGNCEVFVLCLVLLITIIVVKITLYLDFTLLVSPEAFEIAGATEKASEEKKRGVPRRLDLEVSFSTFVDVPQ